MFSYVLRRLAATIPVMVIVAILVFLMLRLTPSDPAAIIAGDDATQGSRRDPSAAGARPADCLAVRHLAREGAARRLGESFFFKKQVAELILDRLGPTLSLALLRWCWLW